MLKLHTKTSKRAASAHKTTNKPTNKPTTQKRKLQTLARGKPTSLLPSQTSKIKSTTSPNLHFKRFITTTTTTTESTTVESKLPNDGLTLQDFMSGSAKSPHDEHDPEVSHLGCIPTSISPSDIPDEPIPETIPTRKPKQKVAKPTWLKAPLPRGEQYEHLRETVKGLGLATVCQEARCPNIGECWGGKKGIATATIMLLGDTCTRGCRFCAVKTSRAPPPAESDEPEKTSSAILKWGLEYVVFTMVARDDIPDGGAEHVARTVRLLKAHHKPPLVEALTSDFQGSFESVKAVVESGLDVFAHNVETVRELQHVVRDRRTTFDRSVDVLKFAKQVNPDIITKTSLMLGCGETDEEIVNTLKELRAADVNVVTFGQYLQPTSRHMKVVEYVTPEKFQHWQTVSEEMGFLYVASGPMVRSSYRAGEYFIQNVIEKRKAEKLLKLQQDGEAKH
jgi:lipoic acid synthetase